MASAQTEPSMDEILASIRRIISEEDDAPQELPVRQKLETLQLRDAESADDAPEPETAEDPKPRARAKKAAPEPEPEDAAHEAADEAEIEAAADPVSEAEEAAAADDLDDFEPLPEEPVQAASTMEPAAAAQARGETVVEPYAPAPSVTDAVAEAVRPAAMAAAAEQLAVSEEAAGQAASAFGALEENMRLSTGSGRTIEDLVEAMLAPMLKDWLDANLPRIVEDKVEEEVRRISRRR